MPAVSCKPFLFLATVQWLEHNQLTPVFTWKQEGKLFSRVLDSTQAHAWTVNERGWYSLGAEPSLIPQDRWVSVRAEGDGAGVDLSFEEHAVPGQGLQPHQAPVWFLHRPAHLRLVKA